MDLSIKHSNGGGNSALKTVSWKLLELWNSYKNGQGRWWQRMIQSNHGLFKRWEQREVWIWMRFCIQEYRHPGMPSMDGKEREFLGTSFWGRIRF